MRILKGASINYVDKQEGGRISQILALCSKLVKISQNSVNVVYGCPWSGFEHANKMSYCMF